MSPAGNPQAQEVRDASQVGGARRAAVGLAGRLGFDEAAAGRVAIVATELAGNLARHANHGTLLVRAVDGGTTGVELLALDRGPGLADVARSLTDGVSTGTTPGTGLGAARRQSDEFDIHSAPGEGTVLLARLWRARGRPDAILDVGVVCLPVPPEEESGDGWAVAPGPARSAILVVDGLGHGPSAAAAAQAATLEFQRAPNRVPLELVEALHPALRRTRGAAAAVLELDRERRVARYAGVGNISASIISAGASGLASRSLVSMPGTLGHSVRRFHDFEYAWPPGALVVMHTDGISGAWRLDTSPGLASRHPAVIAGALYRGHARGRDDAAVLVLRERAAG